MSAAHTVRVDAHRLAATRVLPRVGTSLAVAGAAAVSLAPSLLPRSPLLQGAVSGVLIAAAWAMAVLAGRLRPAVRQHSAARAVAAAACAVAVCGSVTGADRWQNALRAAMALPPVGAAHWALTGATAAAVCLAASATARGTTAGMRRVGPARCTAVVTVVAALAGWTGFAAESVPSSSEAQNVRGHDGAAAVEPVAYESNSLVPWASLGTEGRRFVSGGDGIRTYVGLESAPDTTARAALAVRELDRAGGFTRGHVVVAVPTGSGWIDGEAARGLEQRFSGDVAIVGQQYSSAPSWLAFLFDRADAEESARALFTAVAAHIAAMPAAERPALHVYGQSLGSVGGSAVFDDPAARNATCSVLWAGPPAGAVDTRGASVLANSSDPVVWWSPALLTHAPDLSRTRVDAPVPQWIPLVSFVQTTVDLVFSLDAPTGHGHRYGPDQGRRMPGC